MINASGVLFYSIATNRCLFLLRDESSTRNTWGLVGGKIEADESIMDGLRREIVEEIGFEPAISKYIPLETFTSSDLKFMYYTYVAITDNEFIPLLNHEHSGYAWTSLEKCPRPLHPGVWNTLNFEGIKQKISAIKTTFVESYQEYPSS
jgi:8-oxo-dGTP pyrophosphatase MutT (NUDIX family)